MPDEGISSTPRMPRCPVCDGATATTPGAVCPGCGVAFDAGGPPAIPDLRRPPTRGSFGGIDDLAYSFIGCCALLAVGLLAWQAPGLLIPLTVFLLPVGIRTLLLVRRPAADEESWFVDRLFGALLTSIGVAVVAGAAGAIAGGVICAGTLLVSGSWNTPVLALTVGTLAGAGVFLFIFVKLRPRESEYDKSRRPPDPEE